MNPERTKRLLEALLQGKLLSKIHHNDSECEETLGFESPFYYVNGWGSAFGRPEDRVLELVTNPELWKIRE